MLSAGDEVRSLLGRYCELIDAGDFDGVGALMADAVLCTGPLDHHLAPGGIS